MNRRVGNIFFITFLCVSLILTGRVFADLITFTALDGGNNLILNGYTSPLSLVTFIENQTVIGTTSSDSKGWFEKKFTAPIGNYLMSIHSTSPKNKMTPSILRDYTLIPSQATELGDILLPPAIDINKTTFSLDDSVVISGYSRPSATLALVVTGAKPISADLNSDENGYYNYAMSAKDLTPGSYIAQIFSKDSSDQIIGTSFEVAFQVNSELGNSPEQIPAAPSSSPTVLIPTTAAENSTSALPVVILILGLFAIIAFVISRILNRNKQASA